jgi:hypothetical protein
MKRKPFVVVIGVARSGKTTVIRSLTGYPAGNPNNGGVVTDLASNRSIFVIDKSPQESGLTAAQFVRALRRCVNDDSISASSWRHRRHAPDHGLAWMKFSKLFPVTLNFRQWPFCSTQVIQRVRIEG